MKVIGVLWALAAMTSAGLVAPLLGRAASLPTSDPLPGAAPFSAALEQQLMAALGGKGASYHPQTRHLRPGEVRAAGLMGAVELVRDKDSREPFPPEAKTATRARARRRCAAD
jgi:hypothetical protein